MIKFNEVFKTRQDLAIIAGLVPPKVNILDLGCGDGTLLKTLRQEKNVHGIGLEISQDKILSSVANDVPVIHGDLNQGLSEFRDKSFDYVILGQTIQAVDRPDMLLTEMVRVGHNVLISFINMGYWRSRVQIMFGGRMPETQTLPFPWYNTPNIHLATINDFRDLCKSKAIQIVSQTPIEHHFAARTFPNLFASNCVFLVTDMKEL